MATEYRIWGISTADKVPVVRLQVGKRDRLEDISLSRPEAYNLLSQLLDALRAGDPEGR